MYGLWVELELSGLDLRQVEHLVDEAKEMSPSAVHALQRLLRLFRAEPRGVCDHHFGQPDDGIERRAQVVTSSICLSVNGSTVLRVKISTPVGVPSRSIGTPRLVRTLANPDPTVSLISASALVSTT